MGDEAPYGTFDGDPGALVPDPASDFDAGPCLRISAVMAYPNFDRRRDASGARFPRPGAFNCESYPTCVGLCSPQDCRWHRSLHPMSS